MTQRQNETPEAYRLSDEVLAAQQAIYTSDDLP
jgi:hypothetical protein